MAYIDIVAVRHQEGQRTFLFQAPPWTYAIKPGVQVLVETKKGEAVADVVAKLTVDENGEDILFISAAMDATLPLKRVLGILAYNEIHYPAASDGDAAGN